MKIFEKNNTPRFVFLVSVFIVMVSFSILIASLLPHHQNNIVLKIVAAANFIIGFIVFFLNIYLVPKKISVILKIFLASISLIGLFQMIIGFQVLFLNE